MAIKTINYKGTDMIESGKISFANSNIVSIVGMNGAGKSILMKNLQSNVENDWFKQVVHKKDIEFVEKELKQIFNSGNSSKDFMKYISEVKEDSLKNVGVVHKKLDMFIWNTFFSSYKNVIENNFEKNEAKEFIKIIKKISEKEFFTSEVVLENVPEINDYVKLDKLDESSNKLSTIWKKQFGNPKIRSIDLNASMNLSGKIHQNGIGIPSLHKSSQNGESLFVRLIRVVGLDANFKSLAVKDNWFTKEHNDLLNDWLKSYLSQDIKIKLNASSTNYEIWFYELDETKRIEFNLLSSGTKNLIKIISQLGELNSETIIQIDEPETGMHPIMQIQFRDFLEDLTKKYQVRFIVYTHSTHIVKDGPTTAGLNIMVRKDGISKLYSKDDYAKNKDINDIQIFEQIGFESIEKSYNFDTSKKIIIAEGDTDVIYITKMARLLDVDINVTRSKLGGSTNIERTAIALDAVHGFPKKNIILSPDLDIEEKDKTLFKKIKDSTLGKYRPVGTKEWPEIEGMFAEAEAKFVANKSSNNNAKMNKANLFWREITTISQLSKETIGNFKKYFADIK